MIKIEQRTPEWFALRRGRLTASSVGAVLGNSPHTTRDGVMRRMVREWHGAQNEMESNIATEFGNQNEDGALVEFEMETGLTVRKAGFVERDEWAGCSPDGIIGLNFGLEIKCPFGKRKDDNPQFKTLAEQPHYYDQVQFSLWVTSFKGWKFYQWAPGGTALEDVAPDWEWQATNIPILKAFHEEYLRAIEKPDEHLADKRVEIDTWQAHKIVSEYDQLGEAIDNATARRKELLDEMVRLSGGKNAEFAGRNLTKVERKGSVSYAKALAKYAPDADLEPFRGKPSTSWRLT